MKRLNLYYERRDNGFTQADVARFLKISHSYYSMVESGKRTPSFLVVKKLEELFECAHTYLFSFKEVDN